MSTDLCTTGSSRPLRSGRSHQYEFARLNLTYTLMSKRKLLELVQKGLVSGWDDPRMPTLCGVRRRGYTAEALKMFCEKIGVSKRDQMMDIQLLEWCVRQDLNARANRYMVVQKPLKVTLTNWEPGKVEWFDCPLNPAEPEGATRKVPFTGEFYIERDDFMEDAPKKFFRLKHRRRGSSEIHLHHQVRGGRQGCRGQCRRAQVHLRPYHEAGRRRMALCERHHPLGFN